MATNQQNFRVRNGLTIDGATSGSSSFANPATGSDVSFTLPGVYPASNGYVLASTTAGVLSWVANPDANTTYTIDSSVATGGANLNLVGSDATTDTIKFAGGTNVTITATDANTITIDAPDTNTTYDFNATSTSGGANFNLVGSDATTDTVKLSDGGHITAIYTSGTEVTLGSDATDANTASTIVARNASGDFSASGATLGNVTVGVATDNTIASTDTNGNITLTPNGSGTVIVSSTLDVQGGTITDSTGALSITSGATNTNITLDPNGTGNVVLTFANGGNLTNDRNYVFGAIRNATTAGIGDIWALNVTGTIGPTRGISLDNSADTTKSPGTVLRSFTGGAVASPFTRGRLVFERARGTAASPTAVQSGDVIGSVDFTGYTSTGWFNDTISVVPAFYGFVATENWVSNTNVGATFILSQAPTATTINSAANLINVIQANPQLTASRSDAFTWANGKTGTTQTMGLDVSGNLTVTGDIRINGNDIQNSGGTSAITLSSANATTTIKGDAITLENNAGTDYAVLNSTSATFAQPVGFPVKTAAAWNAITGAVGRQVCVSDSGGGGNPNGMMAFWDTTNARWSYIHDNTAV